MFIDLHCDTISLLHEYPGYGTLRKNCLGVDIAKLKRGDSLAQFFALFVDQKEVSDPENYAMLLLQSFYKALAENDDTIAIALNSGDVRRNLIEGKLSAFLAIEEGGVIQGSLEKLHAFYHRGVRLMTLTWNYPNEIGFPNHEYVFKAHGLTPFGKMCVEEMNRIGMIVDVSHLSDQGFYDVAEISAVPFVASHSNSRSMTDHCRNLTDEMIQILAEKGGVMGVNFASEFLGDSPISRIDDMLRHIRHIYNIGGIEVLAIGTDYDGIDSPVEIEDCGQMEKLQNALRENSFTSSEIDKICYKNSMRVIKDCLKMK